MRVAEFAVNFLFTVRAKKSVIQQGGIERGGVVEVPGTVTMKMDVRTLFPGPVLELVDATFWVRDRNQDVVAAMVVENGIARLVPVDDNPTGVGDLVLDEGIKRLIERVLPDEQDWKDLIEEVSKNE